MKVTAKDRFAIKANSLLFCCVCSKKGEFEGERKLQRLFSTFPAGWPGVGLLLLRAVAGFTLLIQGTAYLNDWRTLRFDSLAAVVLAFSVGLCLLAGILTPVTSILVVLGTMAYAFSWVPEPAANLFASKIAIVYVIAMAIAIAFLGPGAFSMDARLFGRREIFIPVNPRSQKS